MCKKLLLTFAVVPLMVTSCATTPPPAAFHQTDNSTLVVESLDKDNCQILQPTASARQNIENLLRQARSLPQHQTAVVILENYSEREIGTEFRNRTTPWFVGLRMLGYEHIYFLQGCGTLNPEGLPTIAEYD